MTKDDIKDHLKKTTVRRKYTEKKIFLDSLKSSCAKCGEIRPYVIHFHHVNPREKEFNLANCGTRAYEVIFEESLKCVCLCANCHEEFHHFYGLVPEFPEEALEEYLAE